MHTNKCQYWLGSIAINMAVLSTLKTYWDICIQQFEGPGMDIVQTHKWSIIAAAAVAFTVFKYVSRPRNLPPGPRGLPIIGALLDLSYNFHKDCMRFSEKYKSDIVSFYIGRQLNVVLNSAETVKLAFAKSENFVDRDLSVMEDFDFHEQFVSVPYSEESKKLKTFCMSSLKTHGFGTGKSEDNVKLQLTRMISHLAVLPENVIDSKELKKLLSKATACIITKILVNQNYEFDDPELEDFLARVKSFNDAIFESAFIILFLNNMLPAVFMYFIKRKYVKACRAAVKKCREAFIPMLEDHRETLDMNHSRDFMDDILIRDAKNPYLTDLQILDTMVMFSPDATETSASQAAWVLFYICWHPEIQETMVKEIKSVCGDNVPGFRDRSNLPYCEAVMIESTRMSVIAALSGGHLNNKDVELTGYFIPKNTPVQANYYAVHYDDRVFPEPHKFKPERYLSPEGKLTNLENVMAFGTGRRKCIGEPLTKSQIFFYVAGLVQKFELSFAEGHAPTTMETDNLYRKTPAHKIKFIARY